VHPCPQDSFGCIGSYSSWPTAMPHVPSAKSPLAKLTPGRPSGFAAVVAATVAAAAAAVPQS